MAEKRARKELSEFCVQPFPEFEVTLENEDNPLHWEVVVLGPIGSPYEGGRFLLQVEIPMKYPFSPPNVMFSTEIYHCNLGLAVAPKRCHGGQFLQNGQKWHPSMHIRDLLLRIHNLMAAPEIDGAISESQGVSDALAESANTLLLDPKLATLWKSDRLQFEQTAREWTHLLAKEPGESSVVDLLEPPSVVGEVNCHSSTDVSLQARWSQPIPYSDDIWDSIRTALCRYEKEDDVIKTQTNRVMSMNEFADSAGDEFRNLFPICVQLQVVVSQELEKKDEPFSVDEDCQTQAGDDDDDDEIEYVPLKCPVCGLWYAANVLGIHLEGHFAFDSCALTDLRANATCTHGESEPTADDALAARLQQEEIEMSLKQFHSLAGDRLAAMQLERSFHAEVSSAQISSTASSKNGDCSWICTTCTLENKATSSQCEACGNAGPSRACVALDCDVKNSSAERQPRKAKHVVSRNTSAIVAQPSIGKSNQANKNLGKKALAKKQTLAPNEAEVLAFAKERGGGGEITAHTDEYKIVTGYFKHTLGVPGIVMHGLHRLAPRQGARESFRPGASQRIMFHGCKTLGNEQAIVRDGFKVSKCISGGSNYGTWVAYKAAYSDSGFAFNDAKGIRHMFICMVSNAQVVLDNSTMRVVGQGCAIPIWIVTYTHAASSSAHTFNVGPYGRWGGAPAPAAPVATSAPYGWEVRNGQWVPVAPQNPRSLKR